MRLQDYNVSTVSLSDLQAFARDLLRPNIKLMACPVICYIPHIVLKRVMFKRAMIKRLNGAMFSSQ